jgi:hypothetical protein
MARKSTSVKAKKPTGSKSTGKKKKAPARKSFEVHRLADSTHKLVRVERTGRSKNMVATVLDRSEAERLAAELHPPKIIPIRNDPDHVIRCDWSINNNEYICVVIDADDPRATL